MRKYIKSIAFSVAAVLLLSGCSEKTRQPETNNTNTSQETGNKTAGSLIPDDDVIEKAAEDMRNGEVWLTLNADGGYSLVGKDILQETLNHFSENTQLNEIPYERVAFYMGTDHSDNFYSKEFLVKCLRKAFELISENEDAKKSLEAAVISKQTAPDQAIYSIIDLSLSDAGSIRIAVAIRTLGEETYSFMEEVPIEGEITDAFESGIDLSAENSLGEAVSTETPLKNDKEIYERLKALREDSEIKEDAETEGAFLTIDVNNTLKSKYIYCTDGSWYYSDIVTPGCRFIPRNMTESALMEDELVAYAALDVLSGDNAYTLDLSSVRDTCSDSGSPCLNTDFSGIIGEIVDCYISERSTKQFYFVENKDYLYYCEQGSSKTDVVTDGVPYYQSFDEYEYFGNTEEKYCRHEFYDIYYPAEKVEGMRKPVLLAKQISDGYTFAYGVDLSLADNKYRCEIYRNDDNSIAVLVDENGSIASAWEYGIDGLTIITSVESIEKMPFDMEEMLEHARTHTKEIADQNELDKKKTAADWFSEDTAKYGLPDLSGTIEEGEKISDASTVQSYLNLFGSGKPFTIEYRSIGGFRNDYNYLTTNGIDFYEKEIVSSHDNSFNYEITEIYVGDYVYRSDDKGGFRQYPKGAEYTNDEIKHHLPDALMPFYDSRLPVKAYKGTINGEEYDIEEWPLRDQTAKFFCRDGKIIAIRYMVYDRMTVFYITKFTETAEQEMIKAPDNSNEMAE